ncbi:MAG: GntR family transcriptional regulator [Peptococcaceae bacterium]|nr:GntR family transcriptional regulator [Peptococcaceae bacterium]
MVQQDNNYEKLISYIEQQLLAGALKIGDRLPAERELSAMLEISRGSVRFGMAVLVAIGVVCSKQGSGNYINGAYDHKLTQIMTMMYALDDMDEREVFGFRYSAEREAILLAPQNIDASQIAQLRAHLQGLLTATDKSEQTYHDQMLHQIIVEASKNRLVIARYKALNTLLSTVIRGVRDEVGELGTEAFQGLERAHINLVEGICSYDFDAARAALDDHYDYLMRVVKE